MKHLKGFRKLNRNAAHRKALYRNMVEALFSNERICTTVQKAKEIRKVAEKLITKSKNKTLHNIRNVGKTIKNKEILMKLFDDIAPRYMDRPGGYTRIIKAGRRAGDGAYMAYLELIEEQVVSKKKKKKKKVSSDKTTKTPKDETTKVEVKESVDVETEEKTVEEPVVEDTATKEKEDSTEAAEEKTVEVDEVKETVEEKKEEKKEDKPE
jgi:large subunit ribosomal protein L17